MKVKWVYIRSAVCIAQQRRNSMFVKHFGRTAVHTIPENMLKFLQPSLKPHSPWIPWVGAGKAAGVWITLSRAAGTQSGKTPAGVTRPNLSLCIIHASFSTFFGRQLVGRKWFPINSGPLTETAGLASNPDRRWPLCSPHTVKAGRMTALTMRQC